MSVNNRIEKDIARNILNVETIDFLTDTDQMRSPETEEC